MKTAKTNWIGTILSCLCDIAGFVTITYLLAVSYTHLTLPTICSV